MSIYQDKMKETDLSDPQSVIDSIRYWIDSEYSNEQKLYGIGYLLNSNKEQYIAKLRIAKESAEREREKLKSEVKKLSEPKVEVKPKKKVVVIKRA